MKSISNPIEKDLRDLSFAKNERLNAKMRNECGCELIIL